jgi:hypothetical protein
LGCLCGRWDVETEGGLLDEIPDWQLLRWIEFEEDEPFNNAHKEKARILDTIIIANSVRGVGNSFGAKMKMVEVDNLILTKNKNDKAKAKIVNANVKRRNRDEEVRRFEREMRMIAKCGKPMPGK